MEEAWIKCRVFPGMFSDERVVEIDGWECFVEATSVRITSDGAEVQVDIVERNGQRWAVVPTRNRDSIPLAVDRDTGKRPMDTV